MRFRAKVSKTEKGGGSKREEMRRRLKVWGIVENRGKIALKEFVHCRA